MKKARLIFKEQTPYSLDFEDYYFNSDEGVAESEFIYANSFEFGDEESFIVAETGFGIGLNFFLTLKRFLSEKKLGQRLFYVSVENYYLSANELELIYKKLGLFEDFKPFLDTFLRSYPKQKNGYYRFYFDGVFLDLIFDDISVLKELNFKANVWFLDGFSPAKNKEMFDESLILNIAKLSKENAQICTFSAASSLQKALAKNGFLAQKIKGFKKREMIRAFFKPNPEFLELLSENKEAYFAPCISSLASKKVAIIGAGIAGASLAYELSLRGFEISVFDKNDKLGVGASGNESGILSSLILKPEVRLGEFSQNAFIEASRFYKSELNLSLNGVFEFAYNDLMQKRFDSQSQNPLFKIDKNTAFLADGGVIEPKFIVKTLLEKSRAKIHFKHEFIGYELENDKFKLKFANPSHLSENKFGVLIYAMGSDSKDFMHYEGLCLSKVRGQVSYISPTLNTKFPLSSKGYICPPKQDLQVIGASYDRLNDELKSLSSDDELNLANLKDFLKSEKELLKSLNLDNFNEKNLQVIGSKVGFRSYSSDRFCIVGRAYDESFYRQNYKALLWHKNKPQTPPNQTPNLYFSLAHGSRGFATSILAARYICALLCAEPLGIKNEFVREIHPARFLIRKLKKGL